MKPWTSHQIVLHFNNELSSDKESFNDINQEQITNDDEAFKKNEERKAEN